MWLRSPWFRSLFDVPGFRRSLTPPRRRASTRPRRRPSRDRLPVEALEDRCLLSFSPITSLPVGAGPQAIATADLNGDGNLDLATANAGGGTVSVLLGNGRGGFAAAVNSAAGSAPRSLAVGDFDKDGRLDVAVANGGSSSVSVLLGNGDGSFRAPVSIGVGADPLSVAAGDFNADGKMDLTVSSRSEYTVGYYGYYGGWYTRTDYQGHVSVLLGDGRGGFAASSTYNMNSGSPVGLAVSDLNADGKLDLVTANEDRGTVSVLMGNGDGTLRYSGWPSDFATGWSPRAVTVGDFTGDGKLDLATAGQTVDVLPGLGDGTFQPVRPTYVDPVAIAAADFDRDGRLDVATADAGSNTIAVLLGRGNGTFTPPVEFADAGPTGVAVGDFNGDGRADVAASNGGSDTVLVLLNDGNWPALDAPSLQISDATLTEGNAGAVNASFTVTLSAASSRDVTVRYATADGYSWNTAAAGFDYEARSGLVTIRAGQTTATVVIPVYGDRIAEQTESFFVRLSDPAGAFIADGAGFGTIVDDEPYVSIGSATLVEGNAGTTAMTLTVTLSAASDAPLSVAYATVDGSAEAGVDYEAKTGTVVFAAGQTSATIAVLVYGDRLPEWDESFLVQLGPTPNAHLYSEWGYGTVTDDEPRLSIDYGPAVAEGHAGATTMTFTVRLSAASTTPVSVNFSTAEGDTDWAYWNWYYYGSPPPAATAGGDFQSQSGTLTFEPGQTAKTITVLINGDRTFESDEVFSINLTGAVGALVNASHAVGTIVDDEPRISVNSVSLKEGGSGITYFTFTVSLSAPSAEPVTVRYATQDGGATAGIDYQATSGILTFAPGETTKSVTVAVYGDTSVEYDEYFYLVLSSASLNAGIGNGWGYGLIGNDDAVSKGKGGPKRR